MKKGQSEGQRVELDGHMEFEEPGGSWLWVWGTGRATSRKTVVESRVVGGIIWGACGEKRSPG